MANWIRKPWIEKALQTEDPKKLPKTAKAQIIQFDHISENEDSRTLALISDKKFTVKAIFSAKSIADFKRANPGRSLVKTRGGLIFIKKYSVGAAVEGKRELWEFFISIDEFKFNGAEGNTQFGDDLIDSSAHSPLKGVLERHWRRSQLRRMIGDVVHDDEADRGGGLDEEHVKERLLLDHQHVFFPQDQEQILDNIQEWKESYRPPASVECSSFQSIEEDQSVEPCSPEKEKKAESKLKVDQGEKEEEGSNQEDIKLALRENCNEHGRNQSRLTQRGELSLAELSQTRQGKRKRSKPNQEQLSSGERDQLALSQSELNKNGMKKTSSFNKKQPKEDVMEQESPNSESESPVPDSQESGTCGASKQTKLQQLFDVSMRSRESISSKLDTTVDEEKQGDGIVLDSQLSAAAFVPEPMIKIPCRELSPGKECFPFVESSKNDSSNDSYSILQLKPRVPGRSSFSSAGQCGRNGEGAHASTVSPSPVEGSIKELLGMSDTERKERGCSLSESQLQTLLDQNSFADSELASPCNDSYQHNIINENSQFRRSNVSALLKETGGVTNTSSRRLVGDCPEEQDQNIQSSSNITRRKKLQEKCPRPSLTGALTRPSNDPKVSLPTDRNQSMTPSTDEESVTISSGVWQPQPVFVNKNQNKQDIAADFDRLVQQNTWVTTSKTDSIAKRVTVKRKMRETHEEAPRLCSREPSSSGRARSDERVIQRSSTFSHMEPAPAVHLSQERPLYSQQDSLVLDLSAGSTTTDESPSQSHIHADANETSRCFKRLCTEAEMAALQSRSSSPPKDCQLMNTSSEDPMTLHTPCFSSLPSHQKPVNCSTPREKPRRNSGNVNVQSIVPSEILDYLSKFRKIKRIHCTPKSFDWFSMDL